MRNLCMPLILYQRTSATQVYMKKANIAKRKETDKFTFSIKAYLHNN